MSVVAVFKAVLTDVTESVETRQLDLLVVTTTSEGECEVGEDAVEMRGYKQPKRITWMVIRTGFKRRLLCSLPNR